MPKLEISRVHDAYAQGGECPLCTLMEGAERTYLVSFQHSRVMEPNVRVRTNALGFCPDHLRKLSHGENKLGLGLVILTHFQEKRPEIAAAMEREAAGTHARVRGKDGAPGVRALLERLTKLRDSCFICGLLAQDLERYAWTVLYLWRRDAEFPAVLRASRGFCLTHFCTVVEAGSRILRPDRLGLLLRDIVPLMTSSLERLEQDLLAFTQLHQAGNRSLGTDEERSALSRTLQKLGGGAQRS